LLANKKRANLQALSFLTTQGAAMSANQSKNGAPTMDAAFDQIKELNEQFVKSTRQATNLYLDSYEWAVDRTIDLEHRLAELSQQEWLKDVIEAQSEISRELAGSYTTAVRSLLK
jgi:hypothetical protein